MNKRQTISPAWICVGLAVIFALIVTVAAKGDVSLAFSTFQSVPLVNVPTSIAASATATNTEIVNVGSHDVIPIVVSARLTGTNPAAATLSIPIHRSIDGTTFEDTANTTLLLTFTGTVQKVWATNLNVGGFRYIKFNQFVNSGTNIATNISVRLGGKPPYVVTYPLPPP